MQNFIQLYLLKIEPTKLKLYISLSLVGSYCYWDLINK